MIARRAPLFQSDSCLHGLSIHGVGGVILLGGVELRLLANSEVSLSYVVFPPYRRGIARRASLVVLRYTMETLGAVFNVLADNGASLKLATALGTGILGDEPSDAGDIQCLQDQLGLVGSDRSAINHDASTSHDLKETPRTNLDERRRVDERVVSIDPHVVDHHRTTRKETSGR